MKAHRVVLGATGLLGIASFGLGVLGFASIREESYKNEHYNNIVYVIDTAAVLLSILVVFGLLVMKAKPDSETRRSVTPFAGLLSGFILLLGAAAAVLGTVQTIARGLKEFGLADPQAILVVNGTTFDQGIRAAVYGSVILALIAGLNHWSVKIWGRYLNQSFLSVATLAASIGTALWSLGHIAAGINDQKAFPATELTGEPHIALFTQIAAVGAVSVLVSAALLFISAVQGTTAREPLAKEQLRWVGFTLEWMTDSPPAAGNFPVPPVVTSATPVSDAIANNEGAEE